MFIHIHCHSYLVTSPGSLRGLSDRRIPLKIIDFQRFFFLPYPQSAQNIETAGVQKGCSRICTANCTLYSAYFAIFQDIATNLSCKVCTLISCVEGVVINSRGGKLGLFMARLYWTLISFWSILIGDCRLNCVKKGCKLRVQFYRNRENR